MATNPYPNPPIGNSMQPLVDNHVTHASIKGVYSSENGAVSSVITLTPDTTQLEITTVGAPAFVRFVRIGDGSGAATSVISAAGTANFDHAIPSNWTLKIAVPIEIAANNPAFPGVSSQVGANIRNGLYRRFAYKTAGNASIIAIEF